MRRPIIALALGTATLVALPLASADAPKKEKGKRAAEGRLNQLDGQVRELKEQQAATSKLVKTELAEIKELMKAAHQHHEQKKPAVDGRKGEPLAHSIKPKPDVLPASEAVRTLATAQTTTVTKRYYLVPLSSLGAAGIVADPGLSFAATSTVATPIVSQSVGLAGPVCPGQCRPLMSPIVATPRLVSSIPVAVTGTCAPTRACSAPSPCAHSQFASPYGAAAAQATTSSYVVNSLPNSSTLQIRGGTSFMVSPSVDRPYVISAQDAPFYGIPANSGQ